MKRWGEAEDPRRRWLIQALAAGAFSGAGPRGPRAGAGQRAVQAAGRQVGLPHERPGADQRPERQHRIQGRRGLHHPDRAQQRDRLRRGRERLHRCAPTPRWSSRPPPDSVFVSGIKLLTGKLLSVFPSRRPVQLTTRIASIGIRGTGVYLEADPEQTYFCTCYGVADVAAINDPDEQGDGRGQAPRPAALHPAPTSRRARTSAPRPS